MEMAKPGADTRWMKSGRSLLLFLSTAALAGLSMGCPPSSHTVQRSMLGVASQGAALEALVDTPGPLTVTTVVAADWEVPLSGLLNLDNYKAREAKLKDRSEPIQIYFHAVVHPTRGLFIVDSGVEKALRDEPGNAAIRGIVAHFMHRELMIIHTTTGEWLAKQSAPLAGVFLTHLHLDHVSGLPDVPRNTPIYAGPGETTGHAFQNVFVEPVLDRTLAGKGPLLEWAYEPDPSGSFAGVVDVFGDGSFWALHVPGHTPGMTSYLARTAEGAVLLVGDACHTAWGWEHHVEPGDFSSDKPTSVESLERLERFVARHPRIDVRLGHQPLTR
jgi:glyoxylase-like metal-dependent hydrolase (beta-lactamase superfamily II)